MPTVVAHRGLHEEHPENSLSAMKAAWAAGIQWCECDVHLSADGYPIVIHDNTLDRTTTGTGLVRDYFLADIKSLKMRLPNGEVIDEMPCTMEEVLASKPAGAGLLVELKPKLGRLWFKVVDRAFAAGCVVQSFRSADVDLICRTFGRPESTALLLETAEEWMTKAGRVNLKFSELTPGLMQTLQRAGKTVGVWTVNVREEIQRMIDLGVDSIITDEPMLARKMIS